MRYNWLLIDWLVALLSTGVASVLTSLGFVFVFQLPQIFFLAFIFNAAMRVYRK